MQADKLREKFLKYFQEKKHRIIESDSLVPKDDPTVLFTPAGMNQFKKEFLGYDSGFKKAATAQRCLRTDDLEHVGKTNGHHTFFEMLGNFSFGDYFKKEAISFAWEFLTEVLKIDKKKLWVSVYHEDEEAYGVWRDVIGIPKEKIIRLGDKENFWPSEAKAKGPNGPCGPCSEIFYDQGEDAGCRRKNCSVGCGCGRFIEIWNLVFTQFNRLDGGKLKPLPSKNIDTGMGLERLAAVMQGVKSNFQTDLFIPIIREITANISDNKQLNINKKGDINAIADHIRAIVFAIYDGVLPSNDGRGYVIRKLIRKSVLHLKSLGIQPPFLYRLVPLVAMGFFDFYPKLSERKENIAEVVLSEEKAFLVTLNSSQKIFADKFRDPNVRNNPQKASIAVFQLYDTYGIPLEFTIGWLRKEGVGISRDAIELKMQEQKDRSKMQSKMRGDVFSGEELYARFKETDFLGYGKNILKAKIVGIIKEGKIVTRISQGQYGTIILDKTVFYPESGGQIGDSGKIFKSRSFFEVTDTKKIGKIIIHIGKVNSGSFKKGDSVELKIDVERRMAIARNHTATHILQSVLRRILGEHVQQQGSLVSYDKLRFDFTHFKDIKEDELGRIEEKVNEHILDNLPLISKIESLSSARKHGALAFFGEKYENRVRMISIGDISKELCAGTHLSSTGQIGLFKIIQESSISSGVRRIEAITGFNAYRALKQKEDNLKSIADLLNTQPDNLVNEIEKRLLQIKELESIINSQKSQSIESLKNDLLNSAESISGVKLIMKIQQNADMDFLRRSVDSVRNELKNNAIVVMGGVNKERAHLVIGLTPDLSDKIDAAFLIKVAAVEIGGSGGGRKDFAQAGGTKPQNFRNAFQRLKKEIQQRLA